MPLSRKKVFDPILRGMHAWNGVAILLLIVSAEVARWLEISPESAALWRFHVWSGYALILGLAARLSWGLHGPHHARLEAMWHGRAWLRALRTRQWFTEPEAYGHHPLASAAYVAFYSIALVMAATGLALAAIEQGNGPLLPWLGYDVTVKALYKTPHAVLEYFVLAFVVMHIAALILHEVRHGLPLAQAMVSGYQYRKDKE